MLKYKPSAIESPEGVLLRCWAGCLQPHVSSHSSTTMERSLGPSLLTWATFDDLAVQI